MKAFYTSLACVNGHKTDARIRCSSRNCCCVIFLFFCHEIQPGQKQQLVFSYGGGKAQVCAAGEKECHLLK